MKSRLTRKLLFYFLFIILIFSLFSAGLIMNMAKKSIEDNTIKYLEERSSKLANFISEITQSPGQGANMPMMKMNGMNHSPGRRYLKLLNELLDADIIIINKEKKSVESGLGTEEIDYDSLNDDEKRIVDLAFEGKSSYHKSSSVISGENVLSLARPIKNGEEVLSCILVREKNYLPASFIQSTRLIILASTILASILVGLLALYFSRRFIKPISILDQQTLKLTEGDYGAKNNLVQDDELGDLAKRIDGLAERLDYAKKEAESMDQMRDDFISGISHELRTPVTVLKSSLEALNFGLVKADEIESYHNILYTEVGFLEKLINDLLDLNMLRNNKYIIKEEDLNLIDVLNDAIRSQIPLAREKKIEVLKDFEDNVFDYKGDYTRLRQMFTIIINNAIKYSANGEEVKIVEDSNGKVLIKNKGNLSENTNLKDIFKPFVRGNKSKEKGYGLGLAVASEIARRHNISLESREEAGEVVFEMDFKI